MDDLIEATFTSCLANSSSSLDTVSFMGGDECFIRSTTISLCALIIRSFSSSLIGEKYHLSGNVGSRYLRATNEPPFL